MKRIDEGMRQGDLEDLLLPLISVDEYQSKIDNSAVVFGFYVSERGAAEDLNRFMQRSPYDLLDTDISPAPDQHGYFMVFLELLNNDQTAENFEAILDEVAALANIKSWSMHSRDGEHLLPFETEKLRDLLKKSAEAPSSAEKLHEEILSFLTPSLLQNALLERNTLRLEGPRDTLFFELQSFGLIELVLRESKSSDKPMLLDPETVSYCSRIKAVLGPSWSVNRIGDVYILEHEQDHRALALTPADPNR